MSRYIAIGGSELSIWSAHFGVALERPPPEGLPVVDGHPPPLGGAAPPPLPLDAPFIFNFDSTRSPTWKKFQAPHFSSSHGGRWPSLFSQVFSSKSS